MVQSVIKYTYEEAQGCLNTNYYGVQRVTETLLPLLQLSSLGARIVNVSSLRSELKVRASSFPPSSLLNYDFHLKINNEIKVNLSIYFGSILNFFICTSNLLNFLLYF